MELSYDDKRDLHVALTRCNYFPNQKEYMGELPPCFSTRQFTPEICNLIAEISKAGDRRASGFDLVEFRATRHNNVSRVLSLVHPKAYADLTSCIINNWEELKHISENSSSHIKPEIRLDGRAFVMNYESALMKKERVLNSSFAKKVRVTTDIANCFNSIYSHSIPWALVGLEKAKSQRDRSLWFNQLDSYTRACKRNETQGIPIGSGASSIIVEVILSTIDSRLRDGGYVFDRYVDDYTCYCTTFTESENFIIDLEKMLGEFKLSLNLSKTALSTLPSPNDDDWVLELVACIPQVKQIEIEGETTEIYTIVDALTFINQALKINEKTPDGSVLKYALQLILSKVDQSRVEIIFQEVLNLSWYYPILIPFLDKISSENELAIDDYVESLNSLIIENAKKRRSDGMCWPLHIMYSQNINPSSEAIARIIESKDCLAMTLIASQQGYLPELLPFVSELTDGELYTKDSYWILLYQLYLNGHIEEPYDDGIFDCLKRNSVNFVPGSSTTDAEKKSVEISRGMIFTPIEDTNIPEDAF